MASEDDRPNILLITSDQQRADTVGRRRGTTCRTPNLDRLGEQGVIFDRAAVQNVVCIPSRACIQTGRYTHQHGVRYMEPCIDNTPGLPSWELTIMERLQQAGYTTGATGKIHMMPERGFDHMEIVGGKGSRWTQQTGQDIGPAPLGHMYARWLERRRPGAYEEIYVQRRKPEYKAHGTAIVNCLPLEEYVETYILDKSIEFMSQDRDDPWFLWCGFCGPHGPHDPPASHAGLYPFEDIELPATLEADLSDRPAFMAERARMRYDTPEEELNVRRSMSYYYCLVTLIDEYVGRLVDALEEQGALENTLVIYTSDHGEMLGDFRMRGKSNFYEPVIHVPMIVRPPAGGVSGRRFNGLMEVMDIAPTVLDYAGVAIPEQMQATSFRPVLEGGEGGHDAILSEYTTNDKAINGKCLCTDRYKYALWDVERGGEFYDLQEDPLELRNLYYDPASREERDHHAEKLLDRLMRSEKPYTGGRERPY